MAFSVLLEKIKIYIINYIGFNDKEMILIGGCGNTNGKPLIDKTNHSLEPMNLISRSIVINLMIEY